jgi:hypothetical protein
MPIYSKNGEHYLFVHIPKTGGTTIEAVFREAGFDEHFRTKARTPLNRVMRCTPQHFHARPLSSLFQLKKFRAIFTVVRNPYARMQSEFAMRHPDPADNHPDKVYSWIQHVTERQKKHPFLGDNHIRPQVEFIVPGCKVFKLEDGLEAVFDELNKQFGISLPYNGRMRVMSSEKVSGYSSQDVSLTPEALQLIDRFYARDFNLFGYQKVGGRPRMPLRLKQLLEELRNFFAL